MVSRQTTYAPIRSTTIVHVRRALPLEWAVQDASQHAANA